MSLAHPETEGKLIPALATVVAEGLTASRLVKDLVAGVVVGVVALPLAIALAIPSGVKPEQGLYTAVVAGFLISALGGSRVAIGGPTGAFIVIVYGIVQKYGYDGLALATMMAGGMLVVMGLARLGAVIKFIPYPVTVGFTSGIALIIASAQIRDFFGLRMDTVPAEFLDKLEAYGHHMGSWSPWALALGAGTIGVVQLWPRLVTAKVPGSLIAIIATTALVQVAGIPVETIGSRFGDMPNMLPAPSLPSGITWDRMRELSSPALTIALLAAIESLLCAVVADGMIRAQHRSNMELVAQGIANLVSPLFQGICATGAIARTATNVKNGGRTPIAGMVHAVTLLLIMLLFARWAKLIPLATLAGVLLVVAYHMSEWRVFRRLLRSPRSDVLVLVITFLLTVLIDLTVAIQVGVVLAAFLFMRRMAAITETDLVTQRIGEGGLDVASPTDIPQGVEVFSVQGPFFFGAASKFKGALGRIQQPPRVLIFRLRDVPVIDATGLDALQDVHENATRNGTVLLLSGLQPQPRRALERAGLLARIGEENVCENIDKALGRARAVMAEPPPKRVSGRLAAH